MCSSDIWKDHTATPGSRINSGVRLIESDGDIDDDVRAAAGGLESTINGSNDPNPANMTPSVSQQSMLHTRAAIALGDQVTYTSFDPIAYQSHGSNSKTREGESPIYTHLILTLIEGRTRKPVHP